MGYEELSLSGFAKEIKEVSDGSHPRKFCFVLGAGASKSSGIKSGQELVNIWEKDLLERNRKGYLEWKEKLGINDDNKYEFYSQYYEKRFKNADDGYNYLEKLMESAKPSIGYVMLSYILTHTEHKVVITTNFDHLIEDAVNYYEDTIPLVIGHESLADYITKKITRPMIIKIHRDLLLDPKNRESELDTLHGNWQKALEIVFSEYYPIFIGYAGNDHSLMDYLIQISGSFFKEKEIFPYWMVYETDKMSKMVLEFLDKSNGYLIKHSGFDEVLYLLGSMFDYQLPSKEDFISDAEKRYKMLSDSIDAFTEISSVDKKIVREEDDAVGDMVDRPLEVTQAVQHITSQAELQNLFREAVILANTGQYQEAMEVFEQLIEKNSQNARYYSWLGFILHRMGRYEDALKENQRAVELEPDNARYHGNLGVTLHEMGRYEEAQKEKQKALEVEPDNARYHNSLGITLHKMGRYEEAEKEKRRAMEVEPDNAKYHDSLSTTLHGMGCYEEALKETQKALELEPDNARYHGNLGVTLHEMGRYEEALKETQKALELEPDNAEYHGNLGATLHKMGCYEEAEKEIQKALEQEPDNAEYHDSLGTTLHEMGRYEEALKETQKALELEPDNAKYHNSLGVTLHEMGRYEEALKETQKALELEPDNAKYHDSLSTTLHKMGRYEKALKETQKALELEPDNAKYHDSLGVTLHEMERYEEALKEKQRAVELEPDNARYHNSLGITLHKMGRYEEAEKEKQRASALGSNCEIS